MKRLKDYIFEEGEENQQDQQQGQNDENQEEPKEFDIKDIKYTIWQDFETKVTHLKSNTHYQKIEYKYIEDDESLQIDFLLGWDKKKKSWMLYVGKIGATTYSDSPYKDLKCQELNDAIINSLPIVKEYIDEVKNDKDEYSQYYIEQ